MLRTAREAVGLVPFGVMLFMAFGLTKTAAKELWFSMQRCPDPTIKALCYFLRHLPPTPWDSLEAVAKVYSPVRLTETLELLVPKYGNRRLVSRVQDQIASESTRAGRWRLGQMPTEIYERHG